MDDLLRFVQANPAAVTCGCVVLGACGWIVTVAVLEALETRKAAALWQRYEALKKELDRLKREHE